jgi:hypothetical protein
LVAATPTAPRSRASRPPATAGPHSCASTPCSSGSTPPSGSSFATSGAMHHLICASLSLSPSMACVSTGPHLTAPPPPPPLPGGGAGSRTARCTIRATARWGSRATPSATRCWCAPMAPSCPPGHSPPPPPSEAGASPTMHRRRRRRRRHRRRRSRCWCRRRRRRKRTTLARRRWRSRLKAPKDVVLPPPPSMMLRPEAWRRPHGGCRGCRRSCMRRWPGAAASWSSPSCPAVRARPTACCLLLIDPAASLRWCLPYSSHSVCVVGGYGMI